MDGDVHVTTCETGLARRKHTVNARSEIGATVTVPVDGAYVSVDSVAKPPCCPRQNPG